MKPREPLGKLAGRDYADVFKRVQNQLTQEERQDQKRYGRAYRGVQRKVARDLKALPEYLHYHGAFHTPDVVKSAEALARTAKDQGHEFWDGSANRTLTERDVWLVKLAALFHDHGFLKEYQYNEQLGAQTAREYLTDPRLVGTPLSEEDLAIIEHAILDTMLQDHDELPVKVQKPKTLHGRILCDADVASLGRRDYYKTNKALYEELEEHKKRQGTPSTPWAEFLERSVNFLKAHVWHSQVAKDTYDVQKALNVERMQTELERALTAQ